MSDLLKLLPCPSPTCGSTNIIISMDATSLSVYAECSDCGVRGPGFDYHTFRCGEYGDIDVHVAEAWNALPRCGGGE